MGKGVAAWFRSDGPYSADQIGYIYADIAIGMVTGVGGDRGSGHREKIGV